MLLVELPPAYLSSPCGKTATRFFGQRETPPKFKAILEERGGRGRLFLFSRAPADGGRNENDRQTDIRPTGLVASLRRSSAARLFFPHLCATSSRGMFLGDERIEHPLRFCVLIFNLSYSEMDGFKIILCILLF